jgi:hypothetical protein
MVINPDFSITPLVEATVKDAISKARAGDKTARRWLNGEGVYWIEALTGYHPVYIRRAINAKLLPSRQRGKQKTAQEAPGRKNNHTSVVNIT